MGPHQVLPLQVRVYQGVMAMNGYFTFPTSPELEPLHQLQLSVILVKQSLKSRHVVI